MTKIQLLTTALILSLITSFSVNASEWQNQTWIALQVDDEMVTSYEVTEYTEQFLISPLIHSFLYERSKGDMEKYQQEKNKLIQETFPTVLKRMALVRLLQKESLRNNRRDFFQITKIEFKKLVTEHIKSVLAKYPENEARTLHVEQLKKNGFPHYQNESHDQIFRAWVKKITFLLRENYRQSEAFRYLCSKGDCGKQDPMVIAKRISGQLVNHHMVAMRMTPDTTLTSEQALSEILKGELKVEVQDTSSQPEQMETRRFFFIGKVEGIKIELRHFNDFDLTGGYAQKWGYPDTDDMGRTFGFYLGHTTEGDKGSLTVELEDWLFSKEVPSVDGIRTQESEEQVSLRVTARQFLDNSGNTWVIMGFSGSYRTQDKGAFLNRLQDTFHQLNRSFKGRNYVDRDGESSWLSAYIGIGGKYSLIDTKHVDLIFTGEGLLAPAVGDIGQSAITLRSSLDLNIYGKNEKLPILQPSLFYQVSFTQGYGVQEQIGGKISVGAIIKSVYVQAGVYVVRYNETLDRTYEDGPSWNMGILISVTILPNTPREEFEFN